MRSDPKGQMEGDLAIAVGGLIIRAIGGRDIIAGLGALVVLLGFILAAVNMVIWLTGPRRRGQGSPLQDEDDGLLQLMRDEGRGNRPPEPLRPPPAPDVHPVQKPELTDAGLPLESLTQPLGTGPS